jgi:N-acetylglutamate synthase-like GNAT family acetyltransferase
MTEFEVRVAVAADADAVSALLKDSYERLLRDHYAAGALAAALPLMTRARPDLLTSGTYFVGQRRHEIVGCGGWTQAGPAGSDAPGRAHIRHFATSPASIRTGVGRTILQRCLAEMRDAGAHEAECLSTLMAEPFYASQGFERVGVETVRLGGTVDFPAVKMRRRL